MNGPIIKRADARDPVFVIEAAFECSTCDATGKGQVVDKMFEAHWRSWRLPHGWAKRIAKGHIASWDDFHVVLCAACFLKHCPEEEPST